MKWALSAIVCSFLFVSIGLGAIKQERIEYKQGDATLKSELFYDDATAGKRPGILVFPEWWGLNDYARSRAKQLAELGYVAMAVDVYGNGFSTTSADEAGQHAGEMKNNRQLLRDRVNAALEQLRNSERVDSSRTAAIGYCFGGMAALELARSGADVQGIVTFHGSLDTPTPDDAKNIVARILVCQGGADPFVTPADLTAFEEEMRKANVDWQVNIYGGAKHSFTNPESDKTGMKGVGYNEKADHRSWEAMKLFFNDLFGPAAEAQ